MSMILKIGLLVVAAGAALVAGPGMQGSRDVVRIEQLFVLGDSLSDTGNAAAVADFVLDQPFFPEHTVGLCNPLDVYLYSRGCGDVLFRQSRVTDGPVAVETLALELGLPDLVPSFHTVPRRPVIGTNYAVASAKARGTGHQDLLRQLDMLHLDHGPDLTEEALYVLMIGGNDAIDALQAAVRSAPEEAGGVAEAVVTQAVDAIGSVLARLVDSGARHVLVANLPDLAAVPAVHVRAARSELGLERALELATEVTAAFNRLLAERLASLALERPEARIVSFDLHAFFQKQMAHAREEGRNATDACFDSEAYRKSMLASRRFHADCAPAGDGEPRFAGFLFWDQLHPTASVHAAVGAAMAESWRDAHDL